MPALPHYHQWTQAQLQAAAARLRKKRIWMAVCFAIVVGFLIFSIATKGMKPGLVLFHGIVLILAMRAVQLDNRQLNAINTALKQQ